MMDVARSGWWPARIGAAKYKAITTPSAASAVGSCNASGTSPRQPVMGTLAALLVGGALVLSACSSPGTADAHGGTDEGSCVSPYLRSDSERRPPSPGAPTTLGRVVPGQQVTVFGRWYFAIGPCNDIRAAGENPSPAQPGDSVSLRLTTSDRDSRIVAMAAPSGAEASFAATFVVPDDAAPGPARVSDERGHVVTLTIDQRYP